jgi:hypothetical protein
LEYDGPPPARHCPSQTDVDHAHAPASRDLARNVAAREQLGLAAWHQCTGTGEHFHLDEALALREMRKRDAIEPFCQRRGAPPCVELGERPRTASSAERGEPAAVYHNARSVLSTLLGFVRQELEFVAESLQKIE